MLYVYGNKIYVKPLENKLVEVIITKKGNEYDVKATDNKIELEDNMKNKLYSIALEKAYEMQKKII